MFDEFAVLNLLWLNLGRCGFVCWVCLFVLFVCFRL